MKRIRITFFFCLGLFANQFAAAQVFIDSNYCTQFVEIESAAITQKVLNSIRSYNIKVHKSPHLRNAYTTQQTDSVCYYKHSVAIPNPDNLDDPYDLIIWYDTTQIDSISKLEGIVFAYMEDIQSTQSAFRNLKALSLVYSDGYSMFDAGWLAIEDLQTILTSNELDILLALAYFSGFSSTYSRNLVFDYNIGLHKWILKLDTERSSSKHHFSFFNLKSLNKTGYEIYRIPSLLIDRFEQDDSLLSLQSKYFFKDSLLTIPYISIANDCKTVNTIDSLSFQTEIYALYPRYVDQFIDFSFGFDFTIKITNEDYVYCLEVPVENTRIGRDYETANYHLHKIYFSYRNTQSLFNLHEQIILETLIESYPFSVK